MLRIQQHDAFFRQAVQNMPAHNAVWLSNRSASNLDWGNWVRISARDCPVVYVPAGTHIRLRNRHTGWYFATAEEEERTPVGWPPEEPTARSSAAAPAGGTGSAHPPEEPTARSSAAAPAGGTGSAALDRAMMPPPPSPIDAA